MVSRQHALYAVDKPQLVSRQFALKADDQPQLFERKPALKTVDQPQLISRQLTLEAVNQLHLFSFHLRSNLVTNLCRRVTNLCRLVTNLCRLVTNLDWSGGIRSCRLVNYFGSHGLYTLLTNGKLYSLGKFLVSHAQTFDDTFWGMKNLAPKWLDILFFFENLMKSKYRDCGISLANNNP